MLIEDVPVFCNVQWSTHDEALAATRGSIDLRFCRSCGHVFNATFDPTLLEYSESYENSLHFSPRFQEHAERLAGRLISKFDLRNKTVVEIGCGKGEFISLLCEAGGNKGYGFDASYAPDREMQTTSDSVTFIREFFGAKHKHLGADFLCCRHVLEHIDDPISFLQEIQGATAAGKQSAAYFEVPNASYSFEDSGIWDLIYEHCSYFSADSARRAFRLAGMEVLETYTDFGNQFLCIETISASENMSHAPDEKPSAALEQNIHNFADFYRSTISAWDDKLENMQKNGDRVVVWGAGSKGVTFLNCIASSSAVDYVVDINPNKSGLYISGTGHEILDVEKMVRRAPDQVIIMNPVYKQEIEKLLSDAGIDASVHSA